jgi:hypothetical protein
MAIVDVDKLYLLNQRVGLIKPNKEILNPYFLMYLSNHKKWRKYAKEVSIAGVQANLSTQDIKKAIIADTPEQTKQRYLQDLKSWFKLKDLVKIRYGERVNYSAFDDQIRRMVAKEIGASEFITIIEPVDIFDLDRSNAEIESIVGTAAQADAIAARIKKVAIERMEEDPILYLRLSQLIQAAIDAHRAKRLGDIELVLTQTHAEETSARFGSLNPALTSKLTTVLMR